MKFNCLNLGCGSRIHPSWTNIDFGSTHPGVMEHDLRLGIPFPDNSFDVVYHSHVLEHFGKSQAPSFMKECFRVLKRGGILRVAVPDLERIATLYLQSLNEAIIAGRNDNYDWMMLELYDQTVREFPGGAMAQHIRNGAVNEDFVVARLGAEARRLIPPRNFSPIINSDECSLPRWKQILRAIFRCLTKREVLREVYQRRLGMAREGFLKLVLGSDIEALRVGKFRRQGEVHLWMYDRYSLERLFLECGFEKILKRQATESAIPAWTSYNLDSEPDGSTYKPDSLFMEGIKP